MPTPSQPSIHKAKRHDRIARWIITSGGIAVIAGVIAILALIVGVTVPLFQAARCTELATSHLPGTLAPNDVLALGVDISLDGQQVTAFVWARNGSVAMVDLFTGRVLGQEQISHPTRPSRAEVCSVESCGSASYSLLWTDGAMSLVEIAAGRPSAKENISYSLRTLASMPTDKGPPPLQALLRRSDGGAVTRVARLPDGRISIARQVTREVMGEEETTTHSAMLREELAGDIRVMAMDREGTTFYAGTGDGRLARWQLGDKGEVSQREIVRAFRDMRAVTSLALVFGDVSLAVGDAEGGLTTWFPVTADSTRKLRLSHHLRGHQGAVRNVFPSGRSKALLSLGDDGAMHLDYMTTERAVATILPDRERPLSQAALGTRGDVVLGMDSAGSLTAWRIQGGHPEVSLKTLFGKVLYEGYDTPDYVWQTTGGEDFEPKLSLVPLLFGTMKGTFYAMLFAAPLALFGAAYTSYFTTPGFRRAVKPVVEIMAAVPSVVIGFLVALWLAPIIDRWVLAVFVSLVTAPAVFLAFMTLWQFLRRYAWARRVEHGYEFLVLLPVLFAGVGMAVCLAGPLEASLFGGNFRQWLFDSPLAMRYDQRNSVIIAFGLGFAVVPIIFSIAEDALGNVPQSMSAASMALGASRWQTLWRVVLPSASPGIFAAVMIGFGRAVGETMIVLMATGNTPTVDWSPLNGMRTLAANIAVEIPEAPVGGTLYRVIFLCAVLLFLLTFLLNTAAELVRQQLRKRYGRF